MGAVTTGSLLTYCHLSHRRERVHVIQHGIHAGISCAREHSLYPKRAILRFRSNSHIICVLEGRWCSHSEVHTQQYFSFLRCPGPSLFARPDHLRLTCVQPPCDKQESKADGRSDRASAAIRLKGYNPKHTLDIFNTDERILNFGLASPASADDA
jgi:hypothetical protein